MFGKIAHSYDRLNRLLSASVDRHWRRVAAAKVGEYLPSRHNACCLDLCAGTGDLAIELRRQLGVDIVATDFSHPMLVHSAAKIRQRNMEQSIRIVEADALELPFTGEMFDAVTIGFGLRNLEDPARGLAQMCRLLKNDGVLVVLEFSRPVIPVLRTAFQFYFHHILPRIGAWISGDQAAYRYLPESVGRFPSQRELVAMMEKSGLSRVSYRNLSGGIAALHWGLKQPGA
jgi:demethylmenaquinone methyltransferase/2-methoxy-6-polyprenyl-1,4-benzoquinol methylase